MAERIPLVRGDTRPQIRAVLVNQRPGSYDPADVVPVDVTGGSAALHFRAPDKTVLFTLAGTVTNGPAGVVVFTFVDGQLDIAPGAYDGEISVTFADGGRQTVYELVKFILRADLR